MAQETHSSKADDVEFQALCKKLGSGPWDKDFKEHPQMNFALATTYIAVIYRMSSGIYGGKIVLPYGHPDLLLGLSEINKLVKFHCGFHTKIGYSLLFECDSPNDDIVPAFYKPEKELNKKYRDYEYVSSQVGDAIKQFEKRRYLIK